jgi:hypothetical protein
VAQNYNGSGLSWIGGDFDGNGQCAFEDLLILAQHYGFEAFSTGNPGFDADFALARSMVPEPVLAATLLAFPSRRRRR